MASLQRRKDRNRWIVRYGTRTRNRDQRVTITLGPLEDFNWQQAKSALSHIEHLVQCQAAAAVPRKRTQDWLSAIGNKLHEQLAKRHLCEPRFDEQLRTVAGLCEHYLDWKGRANEAASVDVYRKTTSTVERYFGPTRDLQSITPADLDDLIRWIYDHGRADGGPLAATTASRRCQTVKSIFRRAARQRWIDHGDFHEMFVTMPKQTRTDKRRQHWVEADAVLAAIAAAANNEQRLIFALARWGGLRIPSELLGITWADIDRDAEKMRITSPKQRQHGHLVERWIPIWPEVRPYLDIAYDEAEPGIEHIIQRHRSSHTASHRGLFLRACYRARITSDPERTPWPKLWINMRSTRATELRKQYRADVVDYWMNHSERVSRDHYQQWQTFDWRE